MKLENVSADNIVPPEYLSTNICFARTEREDMREILFQLLTLGD
jgi:hypothetical protein